MAIAVGQTSKGRTGSGTSQATTGVTTAASGSTFVILAIWDTTSFTSIADSKGNTYTLMNTELAWGIGNAKSRMYYCANGTGGASHTATLTISGTGSLLVCFLEITGAATASFDTSNRQTDAASPFVAPSLSNAQAASMYVAGEVGDSGSNPATLAESTGFTVQSAATETNGASFYTGGLATLIVASIASRAASFTQTGSNNTAVWEAIFKESAGGGGTTVKQLAAMGCG